MPRNATSVLRMELDEKARNKLLGLVSRSGAEDVKEFLKIAFSVYEELLEVSEQGGRVVLEPRDGEPYALKVRKEKE